MKLLAIILFLFAGTAVMAQNGVITVCHSPSAKKFYYFSQDSVFEKFQHRPERISIQATKGKLEQLRTTDFKSVWIYHIPPETPSNKYVLLFHDQWGLTVNIKAAADQLSETLGNVHIIVPDMFGSQVPRDFSQSKELLGQMDWISTSNVIETLLEYTGYEGQVVTLGFGVGGGWALETSMLAYSKSLGTVMYYGAPIMVKDLLRNIKGPVLGFFSSSDQWITQKLVNDFGELMKEEDRQFHAEFVDEPHGFASPGNGAAISAQTSLTYEKSVAFIKKCFN